jgi:hypothetical protein
MKPRIVSSFLYVIIACLLFISCKKDKDVEHYFKVKINGNWVTYNIALAELGPDLMDDTKTNFLASGRSDDQKTIFDITFQVDGSNSIGTGTYVYGDVVMIFHHMVDFGGPNFKSYADSWLDPNPEPHFTVTLSSIDEKTIRGSFTGNYLVEDFTDEVINVTEGEFVLQRIR